MAGKSRKSNTKDTRGGKRPGSGRKPGPVVSKNQRDEMMAAAKKYAEEHGKSIYEILLDFAYGKQDPGWKMTVRDRLAAMDMFLKYTVARVSEKNVNVKKETGPVVGLPETKPDPAKLISIDGGKD